MLERWLCWNYESKPFHNDKVIPWLFQFQLLQLSHMTFSWAAVQQVTLWVLVDEWWEQCPRHWLNHFAFVRCHLMLGRIESYLSIFALQFFYYLLWKQTRKRPNVLYNWLVECPRSYMWTPSQSLVLPTLQSTIKHIISVNIWIGNRNNYLRINMGHK